ncbi:MAG: tryptophan--tRNA ligase [Planctomycetota bacterium]
MTEEPAKKPDRFLSGIQPSGELHLGNYFGAIQQHVACQQAGRSFYFIANYHALTTIHDAARLRELTQSVAATYLACGLDPEKSVFFRHSDVPEVTELTWLLLTATAMGDLQRAVSYKDKIERGLPASAGLFIYPVLMAADILAYDSTVVPVGRDQVQHIEMTRTMARSFNDQYGSPVFTLPRHQLSKGAAVPGTDGAKMSKSYGNTIPLFLSGKPLKKIVMSIETDSTPLEGPKNPDTCTVFALYSLFASEEEKADLAGRYRTGNFGYGAAKKELLAKIEEHFADGRLRYEQLMREPSYVEDVLLEGARKARLVAREVVDRARKACGVA